MVDDEFLKELLAKSFHPDEVAKRLGISGSDSDGWDWGALNGLGENCYISLGLKDNLPHPPNAQAEAFRLNEEEIKKIADLLNDYNFPAVTYEQAHDVSKILVTDSGIHLPYQKSEDAVCQMSDIIDIFKENGIEMKGFAHPVTSLGMTQAALGKINWGGNSIQTSEEIENVLEKYHTTREDFINRKLSEIKPNSLAGDEFYRALEDKMGSSLYRGGTLGDKAYAVMAKVDCKNLVYASPDFSVAAGYTDDYGRGYETADGNRYGFIYEYEATDNQKYFCDYGIENGQQSYDSPNYETAVYPHKNKLKGIYIKSGNDFMKIYDQNGYISDEWKDFAVIHNPVNRYENSQLVERANKIYEAAQAGEILHSYKKRNYDYQTLTSSEYLEQAVSEKLRYDEYRGKKRVQHPVMLTGKVSDTKLLDEIFSSFVLKDCSIGDIDLSYQSIKLKGNLNIAAGAKLPPQLEIEDAVIPDGTDLSKVEYLTLSGKVRLGKGVVLPEKINSRGLTLVDSFIPEGTNLEKIDSLNISGKTVIGNNVKFPSKTTLDNANIISSSNMEAIENLSFRGQVQLPSGIKLPDKIDAYAANALIINEADVHLLKNCESHTLPAVVLLDENGTGVSSIVSSLNYPAIVQLHDMGYDKLTSYPSVEAYNKCQKVERKLTSLGIDKDSYMMITREHDAYTSYNDGAEVRSVRGCFEEGAKEIQKSGRDVVYGCNNGVVGAYFAEDVYVISKNYELAHKLYYKGEDVCLGVITSNGEDFRTAFNQPDENLNRQYKKISEFPKRFDMLTKTILPEQTIVNSHDEMSEKINKLRGRETLKNTAAVESMAEKTAIHAGASAGKTAEGIIETLSKADNAVNQAIDKTIDKGSELLNNTTVGKAYEKAADAVSNTKIMKAVEKGTAKAVEKAAQTTVGKSVVKAVARTAGSAIGKSVLKKVPLVSVAAGCYFAWDRVKEGDWKGACGEVASGVAGCFPGVGTGISAAIDVGLAAKDIGGAITGAKEPEGVKLATEEKSAKSTGEMRQIILQKQGRVAAESKTPVKPSEISNQVLQQKIIQQGRG